jgi:hypothetical protein
MMASRHIERRLTTDQTTRSLCHRARVAIRLCIAFSYSSLADASPFCRSSSRRPSPSTAPLHRPAAGKIIAFPEVGGLVFDSGEASRMCRVIWRKAKLIGGRLLLIGWFEFWFGRRLTLKKSPGRLPRGRGSNLLGGVTGKRIITLQAPAMRAAADRAKELGEVGSVRL